MRKFAVYPEKLNADFLKFKDDDMIYYKQHQFGQSSRDFGGDDDVLKLIFRIMD